MNTETRREYARYRRDGGTAKGALNCAKLVSQWRELETAGLVRLTAEPEQESYFDVFGEPEGYTGVNGRRVSAKQERKELIESFERDGLWWIAAEYFEDGEWVQADSCGMFDGYKRPESPFENSYVPDLMRSALALIGQPGEH